MCKGFSLSRFLTFIDWVSRQNYRRNISSTRLWTLVIFPAIKSWSNLSVSVIPKLVPRVFSLFWEHTLSTLDIISDYVLHFQHFSFVILLQTHTYKKWRSKKHKSFMTETSSRYNQYDNHRITTKTPCPLKMD